MLGPVTTQPDPTTRPRLSRRTGEELPPAELRALARERSEARRARDWSEADRLRALIEAEGWKVVDKGPEGRLIRAHPADIVEEDGSIRYGWTGSVPAYEGERPPRTATVTARATPDPTDTLRFLSRLTDAPPGTHILVVADAAAAVPEDVGNAEVVRIADQASPGVLLASALRRARGEIIVVGEGWPAEATAGRVADLVASLADPDVAVVGWWGVVSADLRHLSPAGPDTADPVAVGWPGLAFRTTDGIDRGPMDEGFRDAEMLASWWSLVLRDEGPDTPPRSARALLDATGIAGRTSQDRDRASRRDRYRLMDGFGRRADLLTTPTPEGRPPAPRG
jgi:hypothetical protein